MDLYIYICFEYLYSAGVNFNVKFEIPVIKLKKKTVLEKKLYA